MRIRKELSILLGVLVLQALLLGAPQKTGAEPGNNDPLLDQWVRERNDVAHEVLSQWLKQVPVAELKPLLRRLAESELLIMNACVGVRTCYEKHGLLYGHKFTPQSTPALLLERTYGFNFDIAPLFLRKPFPGESR